MAISDNIPKDKEFYIEQYVNLNKSANQIEKEFGFSDKMVSYYLKKFNIPIRSRSDATKGKFNGAWKGSDVGYRGLHNWVRIYKKKPKYCEECNSNEPYDLANISQKYLRDVDDFRWLCRKCHMKSDNRLDLFKLNQPIAIKNSHKIRSENSLKNRIIGDKFICQKCKNIKERSEFHLDKKDLFGIRKRCKDCVKKYYQENKEKWLKWKR